MKSILKTLLALVLATGLALPALAEEAAPEAKPDWGPNIGDLIEPLTMPVVANGTGELKTRSLPGDTIFVLVSSVCSQCRAEMKELATALEIGELKGAEIVLVLVDMNAEAGAKRMGEQTKFKIVSDPDYNLGKTVGLLSTPSTVVVGKDGKIKVKSSGFKKGDYKKYAQ